MKFSVGISVFNKVEELSLLVEILRKFKVVDNIFVSTTSDKNDIHTEIRKLDIDELIIVRMPLDLSDKVTKHKTLTSRIVQSQKELMFMAEKYNSDYYMHTHSDGWPLDESKIFYLISEMINKNYNMAYRGTGLSYRYLPGAPVGELDDHFYFIKVSEIKNWPILSMSYENMPYENINIHGYLGLLVLSNVGIKNSWHYDDGLNWKTWDDTNVDITHGTPLKPSVYNEDYKLLHVHRESFIGFGKNLQAYYLDKYLANNFQSEKIKSFIQESDYKDIIKVLLKKEKELDKRLTFRLISHKNFNRDLEYKEQIVNQNFSNTLKSIIYFAFKYFLSKVFKFTKGLRVFNKDLTSEYPEKISCMK